jgi:putative transposase
MLVYEYKLSGTKKQYTAIDDAIRTVQFIRNKSLRLWMDGGAKNGYDLNKYTAVLAKALAYQDRLTYYVLKGRRNAIKTRIFRHLLC